MVFVQRQRINDLSDYAIEKLFGEALHGGCGISATGKYTSKEGVKQGDARMRGGDRHVKMEGKKAKNRGSGGAAKCRHAM